MTPPRPDPLLAVEQAITAAMKACMHHEEPQHPLTRVLVRLGQAKRELERGMRKVKR